MSPILVEPTLDDVQRSVGFVIPDDMRLDRETARYVGKDVQALFARQMPKSGPMNRDYIEHLRNPEVVKEAASRLGGQHCDVIVDACFSATAVPEDDAGGAQVDSVQADAPVKTTRKLIRKALSEGAGVALAHTLTAAGALVSAGRALGVSRIGLASPYSQEVTEDIFPFFDGEGFTVVETAYAGRESEIPRISNESTTALIRAAAVPDVEAVFVLCTNLRTYGILAGAEEEIGKPVVSVNQAVGWAARHWCDMPSLGGPELLNTRPWVD